MRNFLCTFILIYFCHYSYADEYVSTRLTEFEKGEWTVTAWSNIADEDTIISTNIELPAIKDSYVKDKGLKQIKPALQIRCALKYDSNNELTHDLYLTLTWAVMLESQNKTVTSIFSDGATSINKWEGQPEGAQYTSSLTGDNARDLIRKLMDSKTYKTETKTYQFIMKNDILVSRKETISSMQFNTDNMRLAISPIIKNCKI